MSIEKILNKKSNAVVTEEGVDSPKKPTSSQLDNGEIAVNYHKGMERLFIKNDNDEVVEFVSKDEVDKKLDRNSTGPTSNTNGSTVISTSEYGHKVSYNNNNNEIENQGLNIRFKNGSAPNLFLGAGGVSSDHLSVQRNQSSGIPAFTKALAYVDDIPSVTPQVQSDWNETDTTSKAYILNKPTIPTKTSDLTNDSGFIDKEDIAPVEEVTKSDSTYSEDSEILTCNNGDGEVYYPVNSNQINFYYDWMEVIFSDDLISLTNYQMVFQNSTSVQVKDGDTVLYTVPKTYSDRNAILIVDSITKNSDRTFTAVVGNPNVTTRTSITFNSKLTFVAENPGYLQAYFASGQGTITYLESSELNRLHKIAITGSYNDLRDKPNIPDVTDKADKVSTATNGNFAALDANGNLTDSGHKHSDYLTQHQDLSNYVQKSNTPGLLKNDGTVDTTQYLTQHQDISGKEDITPIEAVASGTTTITAQVNKYYEVAGTVSSLTITLPTPTTNTEVTMVVVHLTVGASPTVVVTSVNEVVKFSAAYSVVANKEYELSCLYNGSKWIVSSMEVAV